MLTECSLRLTECSLKLTECSLKLTECSLKLTECSLKLTECSLKLTECSLKFTYPRRWGVDTNPPPNWYGIFKWGRICLKYSPTYWVDWWQEYSGNVRGTFREHSVNVQWTFREHQGTFSERSVNIQGTFREHSGNIQWTMVGSWQGAETFHPRLGQRVSVVCLLSSAGLGSYSGHICVDCVCVCVSIVCVCVWILSDRLCGALISF
jgi:hypothetical protein